jgi:hypothetical protein
MWFGDLGLKITAMVFCLSLKTKSGYVSQFALKLAEARRWMVHMAPLRRSRGVQFEDGRVDTMSCIRPFYHNFTIFDVLDSRSILIFYLGL